MQNAEIPSGVNYFISGSDIKLVSPDPIKDDHGKLVYMLTNHDHQSFTAIIYPPAGRWHYHLQSAEGEYNARIEFAQTPLHPYIPSPIRLSADGLLVEGRHGLLLPELKKLVYSINPAKFNLFRQSLLSLKSQMLTLPHKDMFDFSNIGYSEEDGFWFLLVQKGTYESPSDYKQTIFNFSRDMSPLVYRT